MSRGERFIIVPGKTCPDCGKDGDYFHHHRPDRPPLNKGYWGEGSVEPLTPFFYAQSGRRCYGGGTSREALRRARRKLAKHTD